MRESEFAALLEVDDHHWWYRGRRRVLAAALERLPVRADAAILDAGCGSGRTMDELRRLGRVTGFDLNPLGVEAARTRGHADVRTAAVEQIPHGDDSFELITCLDVLEHTPDDVLSLQELYRVARPGALLVATVPAYQALWSDHDEANHHYRRYRRASLRRAAAHAGWEPVAFTYFNSILLPAAAALRVTQRVARRRRVAQPRSQLHMTPPRVNWLLEVPLRIEAALIGLGVRLPAGLSLLAVLRKPAASADQRAPAPTSERRQRDPAASPL
ncbi:MAG: class I SAM-dependent methyltransferase [Solirubrobacteraceae bacterium]|jgi:SAM-dependent methyltransferase